MYLFIPVACTELDGSGKLVPDPACLSSTVPVTSVQPTSTLRVPSYQTSGILAITVGSVCAAVAVLLLVVSGIVTWIVIKKYRQRQKLNTPEPPAR